MKTTARIVSLAGCMALGLAVQGCAHETVSGETSMKRSVETSFEDAYNSVKSGAQATARWGGYVIDRVGEGTVRVYHEARSDLSAAGGNVSDAYITTKVKGKLVADRDVHSGNISVDTDAGVVTLRGQVSTSNEATKAVQDALGTGGVFAVNSELTWPASIETGRRATHGGTM